MKKIRITDYIEKTAENVSLTEAERTKLFSVTKEYMALKPVRGALARRRTPVWALYLNARRPVAVALIAVLVVSSGAGVSYAAEGALPGDVLYAVKVSVNEEVRALVAVTSEEKAEWEAHRAEKRLAEASVLAVEGRLTHETETELMNRFAEHADKAVAHVESLEGKNVAIAIDVASQFETEVEAHLEILDDSDGDTEDIRKLVRSKARLISNVRSTAENGIAVSPPVAVAAPQEVAFAMTMRAKAEDSSARFTGPVPEEDDSSAEDRTKTATRLAKSAKKSLTEAEKLFTKAKGKFSVEEEARLAATLAEAKRSIETGDTALSDEDSAGAFHAYQQGLVSLKKLNVFLRASLKGNVKLRIEPVPTPEIMSAPVTVPSTTPDPTETKGRETKTKTVPPPTESRQLESESRYDDADLENRKEEGSDSEVRTELKSLFRIRLDN